MNFGLPLPLVILGVGTLLALVAAGLAVHYRQPRRRIAWALTSAALLMLWPGTLLTVLFPELIDVRYRTYKRFYREIQVGMTQAEVKAALDRHYPTGGPRSRPREFTEDPQVLGFMMNPESEREPNAEAITVIFREGRVTGKRYLAD